MTEVFESIITFLKAIIMFVMNLQAGVQQMLVMIPNAVSMLTQSIAYMPSILVAFATGFITLSIAYLIIGR